MAAPGLLNRVGMLITTLGTGPVTADVLISNRFNTPQEAGAVDGLPYYLMLEEDNDYQIFVGTWTLSSTSFSRDETLHSKIGGVHGTANMDIQVNATLRSVTPAEIIDHLMRNDQAAAIASAATTDIWNILGSSAHITGTTGITSFGTAARAGLLRWIIFDGALTITRNASTLETPSKKDLTIVAGDSILVYADTTTKAVILQHVPVGQTGDVQGASVASAATTDIWAIKGNYAHITGTTDITSFGTAPRAGMRRLLIFDGVLTITHNTSTLVTPTRVPMLVRIGDVIEVIADTTTKMIVVRHFPVGSFGGDVQGAIIPSAATTNIWAATGSSAHISGTTNITSLGGAGVAGGWRFVIFDGALTITRDAATLETPTQKDIITDAGDRALIYADTGTKSVIVAYWRADGTLLTEVKDAAIASGATTNIWAATGNSLHITGTTGITSFGTAPRAGLRKLLIFDGALTITRNASTLETPTQADLSIAAGDIIEVYADTTTKMVITRHIPVGSFGGDVQGAAIASGATTNIWAATGNSLHITGTTGITSFGTAPRAGLLRWIVFDDVLTITRNASTLETGTGDNIQTVVGDKALIYAESTTKAVIWDYVRRNATLSTDGTFAANSDALFPSQKATKTYVDQIVAAQDAMVFKGVVDCSANPDYPAANRGHTYRVSVAGKIGGASGDDVEAGDILLCLTDGTASGTQAAVGSNWSIIQVDIDGAVTLTGTQTLTNKTLTAPVINSPTGIVKGDVGLGNADNTSDAAKPVSAAQQTALDSKLAASSYTAADVLAKLLTVDGSGSGLDADKLRATTPGAVGLAALAAATNVAFAQGGGLQAPTQTIADDAVATFTVNGCTQGGIVLVINNSDATGAYFGMVFLRNNASLRQIAKLSGSGGNFAVLLDSTPTGTTGVDGNVSLAVATDGTVRVENRGGGTRTFCIWILPKD